MSKRTISPEEQLERMRREWDARARKTPATMSTPAARTGATRSSSPPARIRRRRHPQRHHNIYQGKDPASDAGARNRLRRGAGHRALGKIFGEVHAVDVSGEMVARARAALADMPNVHIYQNNGCDLSVIPPLEFDFAYSSIVFQHVPSREIIENYVREVGRLLRPGALFKFQVQGDAVPKLAGRNLAGGAVFRCAGYGHGGALRLRAALSPRSGEQYFWLWFFKNPV